MGLVQVRFLGNFRASGGPLYRRGDLASLDEAVAAQAIHRGVAHRTAPARKDVPAPPAHTMVTAPEGQKGR